MKEIIKAFDNLPLLVKLILALPMFDVLWSIYRVLRALDSKNSTGIIISIILLFIPITCIFDIVMIILKGHIWYYE